MITQESGAGGTSVTTSTINKPVGTAAQISTASQYQQEVEALKKNMGNWAGEPKNQALYQQTAKFNPWWPFTTVTGGQYGGMPTYWGNWGTAQPQAAVVYQRPSSLQVTPDWAKQNWQAELAADKNRSRGINRNNDDMLDPRSRGKNDYAGFMTIPNTVVPTPYAGGGGGGSPFGSSYGGWGGGGGGGGGYGNGWNWNLINWNMR